MGSTASIMQPGQKEIRASIRTVRGVYLVGIAGRFPNANNVEVRKMLCLLYDLSRLINNIKSSFAQLFIK